MKRKFTIKFIYLAATMMLFLGVSFSAKAQTFVGGTLQSGKLASAVAVDASGNVYVVQFNSGSGSPNGGGGTGEVVMYAHNNLSAAPTVIASGIPDDDNASNDYATGIVVDPTTGDVFVLSDNEDTNNIAPYGIIYKIKNIGGGSFAAKTPWITGNIDLGYAAAIAVDASGNIYVDEYNGNNNYYEIDEYNKGSQSLSSTIYTGLDESQLNESENSTPFYAAPSGLAVSSDGSIIYTTEDFEDDGSYNDQGHIDKITKVSNVWTLSHVSNGFSATGLALDAGGNLYATQTITANTGSGFTSSNDYNPNYGLFKYVGGSATQTPTQIYTPLHAALSDLFPFGIAIINDNDIFVTDGQDSGGANAVLQLVAPPTTQASGVSFSNTTLTTTTINWTNGTNAVGTNRAVFMKLNGTGTPAPVNGTSYSANTVFSTGGQIGSTGWYCVYSGAGSPATVNVTGLAVGSTYQTMVVEFNGSVGNEEYLTTTATNNPASVTTLTPTISTTGSLSALSTITGTASSPTSITVSGSNLVANVTAAVPSGFDVSLDNITWSGSGGSKTITESGGSISGQTVYVRLDAGDAVTTYSGNLQLTSTSASTVNVAIPSSTVSPAPTTISSLNAASSTLTNATSVQYTATFAASVSGLSTADFSLNTSGVSGAAITSVSGSGTTWTITVNTGSGDGTIQLDMNSASGVNRSVSNLPFNGATYTIDKTKPTVSISAPSVNYANSSTQVNYTVTYSDAHMNNASINLTTSDILSNLTTTGTASITGVSTTPSGNTVAVSLTVQGNGTVAFTVPVNTASDNAGNLALASSLSTPVTEDNIAPVVTIGSPSTILTNTGPVSYDVSYSDANFNTSTLSSANVTLNPTGGASASVAVTKNSSTDYTITLSGITGNGTLGISIHAGTSTDLAGNTDIGAGPSASFTVNNTPPVVSSITATTPSNTNPTNATSVTYTVTFSEGVTGVDNTDFTFTSGGASPGGVNVTPVSSSVYTVVVSGISGNGTLRLDLKSSGTGIADLAGNAISGGFTGGDTYTFDHIAPTVSISAPSVTFANSSNNVSYTVTYSDADMNNGSIDLTPSDITSNLTTTGTASVDNVTTTPSGNTVTVVFTAHGDGTIAFTVPAGTASDNAGNSAAASSLSTAFTEDNTPPVVTIGAPSSTLTNTGPVTYDVSYSDANFNTSSLSNANITLNSTNGTSASVSVTPNSATDYTVTLSGITGNGTLGISVQAGTSSDLAGNTGTGAGPSASFTVDNIPPTVSSIAATTPGNTNPTNAASVTYTVTFSEAVTGVTSGAFTATTSGVSTAGITVTPVSSSVYTATVNGISGTGTLRLDLNGSGTGITDLAGNVIPGGFTSGDTYTIDQTAPTVNSITATSPSNASPTNATSVGYTVTFSEAVTGVTSGAFTATTSGASTTGITVTPVSGSVYTVTVNGISGSGTLRLDLNSSGSGITDLAGNVISGGFTGGDTYTVDQTPPTATISAPSATQIGNSGSGSVTYTVTYADANFNTSSLTGAGITLNTTGTATGTVAVSGSGTSYTVTISGITGLGTLGISVGAGFASDLAGNTDAGAGPSATFNVLSSDAYLSHISISSGSLKPVAGTPNYTVAVTNATSSVTVTPFTADPTATVTIGVNGGTAATVASGTASGSLPLNLGSNIITVTVTAQDGVTTQPYILTVTRAQSSNTYLSHIAISSGTLVPVAGTPNYTVNVTNATAGVTVTPFTTDPTATVTIGVNGGTAATVASGTPSGNLPLNVGVNTITVTVTAQDGVTTQPYILTVTRAQSSNTYLSSISISSGTLTPVAGTPNYTVNVTNATASVTVTPFTADPTATVKVGVNGGTATTVASGTPSGNLPLNVGANTITVTVTAQDGVTMQPYILTVTRAQSSNTYLSSISISSGTLTPVAGTPNYTVNVTNATSSVTVTPFTADPTATVKVGVNGGTAATVASGTASGNLPLNVGINTITVTVTAQDGVTTQPYTVTITRAQSSNTYLSHISISSGTLTPVTGTQNYTVNVTNATSSVTVTPFTADPTATVKVGVNGGTATAVASGTPSGNLPLNVGANTITVTVTAQDGVTTQPYIVTVTRAQSSNTYLSSISISSGTLTPVAGTPNYTVNVTNATASVTVTPFTADPTATVTVGVNGGTVATVASGTPSGNLPLNVGTNTITILVTAQDRVTTHAYVITVTRATSGDIYLTHLAISSGTLMAVTGTPNYTDAVTNAITAVTVTPIANAPTSAMTISVNGGTAAPIASGTPSAELPLNVGSNNITIIVTAQDGVTTQPFVITVTRATGPLMSLYQPIQTVSVTKPTDTITIENDGVMVHQGVSPNGDGINDVLTIDGITAYPDNSLMIIDRNGTLVYQAKGYDNNSKAFDGHSSINGKIQQPGTYFYSLDYVADGQTKHKTGYIILKY